MSLGRRLLAVLGAILVLLAPAIWNGFPLLQWDTGGYLARWHEGTLEVSRSTVYGLFLNALAWLDFWPALVVQAALTVWVIALVLRVHGLGGPWGLFSIVVIVSAVTALPWLASLLLTDIFAGLAVLALYLLVLRADALARAERGALIVLLAFAAATHNATFAVLLALLACAVLAALLRPTRVPWCGIGRGAAALVLGVAMLVAANFVVAGRLAWTPGGIALSFGRMLQDGIVARYLADHCPDPRLRLCAYRAELPRDADTFFWGWDPFDRMGRFQGLGDEMRTIAIASLKQYPAMQAESALCAFARQLTLVATGEGILPSLWHTHWIVETYAPKAAPAMRAARQQRDGIAFAAVNWLHVPVALGSTLLLVAVIALALRRTPPPAIAEIAPLAMTVALAILANAAICGVLANPHDRYGARIAWLATFVLAVLLWHPSEAREKSARFG